MLIADAPAIDRELIECEVERIPNAVLPDVVMSEDRIRHRVRRGVAALTRLMPGWQDRINLNELNMGSCVKCVLGQTFGSYGREPHAALFGEDRVSTTRATNRVSHGFDSEASVAVQRTPFPVMSISTEFEILKRIWTEEILSLVNHADEH